MRWRANVRCRLLLKINHLCQFGLRQATSTAQLGDGCPNTGSKGCISGIFLG